MSRGQRKKYKKQKDLSNIQSGDEYDNLSDNESSDKKRIEELEKMVLQQAKMLSEQTNAIKDLHAEILLLREELKPKTKKEKAPAPTTPIAPSFKTFHAPALPHWCKSLILSTSRGRHLNETAMGKHTKSHFFPGGVLKSFTNIIEQYPKMKLKNFVLIAGFNDRNNDKNVIEEDWVSLINAIQQKFDPENFLIVKTISAVDILTQTLVNKVNEALLNALEKVDKSKIECPDLNPLLMTNDIMHPGFFRKDGYHLSYNGLLFLQYFITCFVPFDPPDDYRYYDSNPKYQSYYYMKNSYKRY